MIDLSDELYGMLLDGRIAVQSSVRDSFSCKVA